MDEVNHNLVEEAEKILSRYEKYHAKKKMKVLIQRRELWMIRIALFVSILMCMYWIYLLR